MFVPELDGDFRITQFTEFYNEHGYSIAYDLPREVHNAVYAVQGSAPIPFWLNNKCHIIPGDADKEEPEKLFGPRALDNPVLRDIARLLDDARSGRLTDRMQEWTSQNISNAFADVFFEEPSRSRYWVTRYRVALAHARREAKPPHPIDNKLRQVAGEWLARFGSKTDLSNVGGLLGSTAHEIFSKRQITDILFAFLVDKVLHDDTKTIDAYVAEPSLHKAFPSGLYQYYLDHGWPRVPFHYESEDEFGIRMMNALSDAREDADFREPARCGWFWITKAITPRAGRRWCRSRRRSAVRRRRSMSG